MNTVTAHCLVKNEENFVYYTIKSVIDFVDRVIVFDTGSTDKTVELIQKLMAEYPGKIIFEEKGPADGNRHTLLRQEMIERTKTDWFMILDGDEIWTKKAMAEATKAIALDGSLECLIAPFYLCVGDIYHVYAGKRSITILGKTDFHYPRFIKIAPGLHWQGVYNQDTLLDKDNKEFCQKENSRFMTNRYWHVTHLRRSSTDDNDYSSGGNRRAKRRLTFFVIGAKINEPVPEVFGNANIYRMNFITSFVNFIALIFHKLL
ncbi:MAG: glycosyltransferase [Patescibacteria group bacterium]